MSETSREFPIRAAPYQHQRKAAAFALEQSGIRRRSGAAHGDGHGKDTDHHRHRRCALAGGAHQRLLVVAPLSILGVWEDEFERFAAFDYNLAVLSGTGTRKADTIRHMNGPPCRCWW